MLARANTVQEAKEIRDLALSAEDWARRKDMGYEVVKRCEEYARRAEIKMGEFLRAPAKAKSKKSPRQHRCRRRFAATEAYP